MIRPIVVVPMSLDPNSIVPSLLSSVVSDIPYSLKNNEECTFPGPNKCIGPQRVPEMDKVDGLAVLILKTTQNNELGGSRLSHTRA